MYNLILSETLYEKKTNKFYQRKLDKNFSIKLISLDFPLNLTFMRNFQIMTTVGT